MKLNLNHNTVIRETLTDGFLRYFQESLVPQLALRYGEGLRAVEMYESHLEKQLAFGGEWYYPLSLSTDSGAITQWIAWEFPKNGAFYEMNPYAYASSDPLAFRLVDEVPAECRAAVGARTPLSPTDALPISVGVVAGNVRMLVGKYSQSFVDALACALTREVEKVHNVRGLAESGIRLEMLFAPNTYMEHTCEGVTYRRLAISEDGARVSKDFWVRWQRAEGKEPVTVSDEIQEGEATFCIGEDVPQKVREKEYRYLLRQNAEKYRSAMGRKTVTEWRELLKKAIKRGTLARVEMPETAPEPEEQKPLTYESPLDASNTASAVTEPEMLVPVESLPELAPEVSPITQQPAPEMTEGVDDPWLARLKEYAGEESAPVEEEAPAPDENTDEFRDAMMRMRSILGIADEGTEPEASAELTEGEALVQEPSEGEALAQESSEDEALAQESALDAFEDAFAPFEIDASTAPEASDAMDEPAVEELVGDDVAFVADEEPDFEVQIVEQPEAPTQPAIEPIEQTVHNQIPEAPRPLFTKPVQENFFAHTSSEPEGAPADSARESTVKQEQSEAELRRQIRDGVLREIEARERERLAEEARRAVIEKEEREAEMARIAKERMEAEASRRELEELREQTRALSEELRAYTQMCMDIMSAPPVREAESAAPLSEATELSPQSESDSAEPVQEEICFTLSKTVQTQSATQEPEVLESTEKQEVAEGIAPSAPMDESTPKTEEEKRYSFTEEELAVLLREHTEKLEKSLLEEARRLAREELEAERAAWKKELASLTATSVAEPTATEDAPENAPVYVTESTQPEVADPEVADPEVAEPEVADPEVTEPEEAEPSTDPASEDTAENAVKEEAPSEAQSQIAELLLRNRREQEEEERRLALEALIREQEEKLSAMRREEEERRARAEQLIAEQARLEELARVERERAEKENQRLEEERRRAEELALQSYEKHLVEAKRLEEELEAARRRREEEDLRIAEAERRIAEQTRLAEEAREQQRMKNEEARRLTEEAQQRLHELDAAREQSRELAERTEEESRLMQQSLQEQEERLRAEALRREQEERQRIAADQLARQRSEASAGEMNFDAPTSYNYVSRVVHLYFGRAIDPNVIGQIHRLMSDTIAYFNKTHVSISVRAEIVGPMQLDLNFIRIPKEEEPLLINIVKVLGRSNIGVRRASIDD